MYDLQPLNQEEASKLNKGDTLVWKHKNYDLLHGKTKEENILQELVVTSLSLTELTTKRGDFLTKNGKKSVAPCGCDRFCSCYGQLYIKKTKT